MSVSDQTVYLDVVKQFIQTECAHTFHVQKSVISAINSVIIITNIGDGLAERNRNLICNKVQFSFKE